MGELRGRYVPLAFGYGRHGFRVSRLPAMHIFYFRDNKRYIVMMCSHLSWAWELTDMVTCNQGAPAPSPTHRGIDHIQAEAICMRIACRSPTMRRTERL